VDIRVVSASDRFLFNPSLIWLPFGKRRPADITFPLAPTFEAHGIDFVHAEATALDLAARKVTATVGIYDYDYLVIATGYRNNFAVVPGLGPGGNAHTITTLDDAIKAGEGWRRFLGNPGDIVVGATQGAGCFGAAYEYLFNVSYRLRKAGLKKQVKLTYVSPEPFLGHFGIGGLPHGETLLSMFVKKEHITAVLNTGMDRVEEGRLVLADGRSIDFSYAMIVPPFIGQEVIRSAAEIADRGGAEHRGPDQGRGAGLARGVRRHARGMRHGRGQQRRDHPGRQDAPAAQARRAHPRTASPRHEARVREVLPVEGPPRLRQPPLTQLKSGGNTDPDQVRAELVQLVRDKIGPVAALRQVDVVAALPKTRSGKILRKTMRGIAEGGDEPVPSTIEDPAALDALRPLLHGD
jgi:AMP-binding enzyme C-terminal domain